MGHRPRDLDTDIKIDTTTILNTKDPRYSFHIPLASVKYLSQRITPDIVHIHTPFSIGILGLIFGKILSIPIIYTHHTDFSHYFHYVPWLNNYLGKRLCSVFYDLFLNLVDKITTPYKHSKYAPANNQSVNINEISVIPTPIDITSFKRQGIPKSTVFDLVFVGRISLEKNIFLAQDTIRQVLAKLPNTKIAIVGDGTEKLTLMSNLSEYLGKNVMFFGELDNSRVLELIGRLRFLLSTSVSETQGLVFQEAWANGVPVISVNCDTAKEYVEEGKNGWIGLNVAQDLSRLIPTAPEFDSRKGLHARFCVIQGCWQQGSVFNANDSFAKRL